MYNVQNEPFDFYYFENDYYQLMLSGNVSGDFTSLQHGSFASLRMTNQLGSLSRS